MCNIVIIFHLEFHFFTILVRHLFDDSNLLKFPAYEKDDTFLFRGHSAERYVPAHLANFVCP